METRGANALKSEKLFTLAEWRSWPQEERWELIQGVAYSMSPAPSLQHQRVLGQLMAQLSQKLKGKPCEPFIAPVDVFLLGREPEASTVVQPDLMIVCDPDKCRDEGILGAPDWILEVLSPSTSYKDQTEKKALYEKAGVREYWILNPDTQDLLVYRLAEDGHYGAPTGHSLTAPVAPLLFPGLELLLD